MPRYIKAAHIMHLIIAGFPGPFSWSMRGFMVGFYTDILSNPVEEIRLGGTLLGALNAFLLHEGWDVAFHAPRIHERLNAFLQDAWLKAHDKRLKESLILYSLIQLKVGGLGDRPALRGLEQQLAGALRPLGSRMQHAADSNKRSLALLAAQVYSHPLLQPHLSCLGHGVIPEGGQAGRVRPASGSGAGIHGIRGASGDVRVRGPGFPSDLRPRAPPLAPLVHPPLESLHWMSRMSQ